MTHRPLVPLILLALTAACGGSPTAPSTPSGGHDALAGAWSGRFDVSTTGTPPTLGSSTWTFTAAPTLSPISYRAAVSVTNSMLPSTLAASATLTSPTEVYIDGHFEFPSGCVRSFSASGVLDAHHITMSNFVAIGCATTLYGQLALSR